MTYMDTLQKTVAKSRGDQREMIESLDIESGVKQCLRCKHITADKLKKKSGVGFIVRTIGDAITQVLRQMNIQALRCEKCGCFTDIKRLIISGECEMFENKDRGSTDDDISSSENGN